MNVNLWGPELWAILHGVSGLSNTQNKIAVVDLLQDLTLLLPCIHCRNSYQNFFSRKEALKCARNGQLQDYVYSIHSQVDEKLEKQKLARLFEAMQASKGETEKISNFSHLLFTRPSLEIVKKRFLLCEGLPFSESSLWTVLISFVLNLDDTNQQSNSLKRKAFVRWVRNLLIVLKFHSSYEDVCKKLRIISDTLQFEFSKKEGFAAIFMAKTNLFPGKEQDRELELSWIHFTSILPARSCSLQSTCK